MLINQEIKADKIIEAELLNVAPKPHKENLQYAESVIERQGEFFRGYPILHPKSVDWL